LTTRAYGTPEVEKFILLEQELLANHRPNAAAIELVASFKSWMRANFDWSLETGRYGLDWCAGRGATPTAPSLSSVTTNIRQTPSAGYGVARAPRRRELYLAAPLLTPPTARHGPPVGAAAFGIALGTAAIEARYEAGASRCGV
jgi:hypothetical protein